MTLFSECRITDGETCLPEFLFDWSAFDGVTRFSHLQRVQGCTKIDGDTRAWCVTNADQEGVWVDGRKAYCTAACPVDEGIHSTILIFISDKNRINRMAYQMTMSIYLTSGQESKDS